MTGRRSHGRLSALNGVVHQGNDRPVTIRAEGLGLSRTVRGGWRRTDVTGEALIQERRSGAVATLAASRGTSCSVEVAEDVVRRITGHRLPAVERVLRTMQETRGDARPDAVVAAPGLRTVRGSRVRLQWVATWSLTSLQQRLVKTGGRLVKHARYYWLLLAEGHLTRRLFGDMLRRIWALPVPAG